MYAICLNAFQSGSGTRAASGGPQLGGSRLPRFELLQGASPRGSGFSRTRAASGGPRPGPTIRAASGGLLIGEAGSRTRAASGGLPQKTPDSSCFRRAPPRGSGLSDPPCFWRAPRRGGRLHDSKCSWRAPSLLQAASGGLPIVNNRKSGLVPHIFQPS